MVDALVSYGIGPAAFALVAVFIWSMINYMFRPSLTPLWMKCVICVVMITLSGIAIYSVSVMGHDIWRELHGH